MKRYRIRPHSPLWWVKKGMKELTVIIVVGSILCVMSLISEAEDALENKKLHTIRYAPQTELTVEELIERKCHEYRVDADIALAIAKLETGHFTSKAFTEYNNVGGLSVNEQPIQYGSLDSGIEAFVINLAAYKKAGLETVEEIGMRWCPVNYESWVYNVNRLMGEENV